MSKGTNSKRKNLEDHILKIASSYSHSLDCGITGFENLAIRYYTGSGYININNSLRSKDEIENKKYINIVNVINSGLKKIANHDDFVLRGTSMPKEVLDLHSFGNIVTYKGFTSTSIDRPFGGKASLVIKSKTGKYIAPISAHSTEKEVLFAPNTKFRILQVEGNKFFLEEVVDEEEQ